MQKVHAALHGPLALGWRALHVHVGPQTMGSMFDLSYRVGNCGHSARYLLFLVLSVKACLQPHTCSYGVALAPK